MRILHGDCLKRMKELPNKSVDLVFTSPPYEDARFYDELEFKLSGDAWIAWALPRFLECLRVCNGLVAWVVEGRTRDFSYSATPIKLMSALIDAGVTLRKPPIYQRNGIPGSGGPDWLRNDYEFIICATNGGKLPWSDNTAAGKPPVCAPGGNPSHRRADGTRANNGHKVQTRRKPNGARLRDGVYKPPALANPGNVINCGAVGGGNMGHSLAHENEAPFCEQIADFFIRSFCKPSGVVLDPFCGSGTTLAVAKKTGRRAIGIELRESQIAISKRRLASIDSIQK